MMKGMNIRGCVEIHQRYLYSIDDGLKQPQTITTFDQDGDDQTQNHDRYALTPSGFYVYDLEQLFKGKIEKYKLASAIGGRCNIISQSRFGDKLSFIQSYNSIVVIPFPHLNLMRCVGMGQKYEYMIWREKNGFFTALDHNSNLLTWSLLTGEMLYK